MRLFISNGKKMSWRAEGANWLLQRKESQGKVDLWTPARSSWRTLQSCIRGLLSSDLPRTSIPLKDYFQKSCFIQLFPAWPVGLGKHPISNFSSTSNSSWPWTSSLGPHSNHLYRLIAWYRLQLLWPPGFRACRSAIQSTVYRRLKDPASTGTTAGGGIYDREVNLHERVRK